MLMIHAAVTAILVCWIDELDVCILLKPLHLVEE